MYRRPASIILFSALLVAGCDMLGIESPEKQSAAREADGKAIGGACRHAARAIEDCYQLNRKADRAAIFAGWRDMNDYMRENKIEPVSPQIAQQPGGGAAPAQRPATASPAADDAAARGKVAGRTREAKQADS